MLEKIQEDQEHQAELQRQHDEQERLIAITHIHELSVKDEHVNKALKNFYKYILEYAEAKHISISTIIFDNNLNIKQHE